MGKAGKWFRSFLTGKKDQKACNRNEGNNKSKTCQSNSITSMGVAMPRPSMPKEKRRWSFRRSSACASAGANSSEHETGAPDQRGESDGEKHALEVVTKDGNMEVLGAKVVDEVEGVSVSDIGMYGAGEVAAALRIQTIYRSCLARTALRALRGLVKLQALIRGHMVRKQATTTLKCMQALITAQVRARTQRIQMMEDGQITNHTQSTYRRNTQEKIKHSYHDMEENIKIVEMDNGEVMSKNKSRNNYSVSSQQEESNYRMDNRISNYYSSTQESYLKQDCYQQVSPTPSAITDMSPRTCSGYLENYSFSTAQSSPQCYSAKSKPDPSRVPFSFPRPDYVDTALSYDYPLYPNYMANTESSRAKARSQSAPKQRPEFERQPSRGRRASIEGRGIPMGARMQRSSSHVGSTAQTLQYPWSIKLDKSTISLKESECGSTCSVLTNTNYCRSVVSYDPRY